MSAAEGNVPLDTSLPRPRTRSPISSYDSYTAPHIHLLPSCDVGKEDQVRTKTNDERCPRCAGRLASTMDYYSRYLTCIMCGFVKETRTVDAEVARAEAELDLAALTTQ